MARLSTLCPTERLRGRPGQRQRMRRLQRSSGLCERCLEAGIVRAADVVDHIVPLALGGDDVDANTRNLCHECHRDVGAEQFAGSRTASLGGCDSDGLPISAAHPWNHP